MNPETVLLEAWLRAEAQADPASLCPDEPELQALVENRLDESVARRVTMHLVCCVACRHKVGSLAASSPPISSTSLRELLQQNAVSRAWQEWVRSLVTFLPSDETAVGFGLPSGYRENSPMHIDRTGRLVIDLHLSEIPEPGTKIRIALVHNQIRLELCDVTPIDQNLYAVIDLAAFQPRAGVLEDGLIQFESIPAAGMPVLLPLLQKLQAERLKGAEFWDHFQPMVRLYGEELGSALSREIALSPGETAAPLYRAAKQSMEKDEIDEIEPVEGPTTRPLRGGGRQGPSKAVQDSAADRVQYAVRILEDYEAVWNECNLQGLPGLHETLAQLRFSLIPSAEQQAPGADEFSTASRTASPRSRRPHA